VRIPIPARQGRHDSPGNRAPGRKSRFSQTSKEALLDFWKEVERKTGVQVNYRERVEDIVRDGNGFNRQDDSC